ncbi:hypothetical protein BV25DRAFT_1916112 [Artomyces pyxidatus]|uniref:Uncharacterized protein n=1 Tax=Artomyces pyxidatus TaxID=48021 RepID=A0ACB8T199_9AGAM|nr:hypothetical protein BV25DRAFT_1916112 [Artomyces pyxidatus]
MPPRPRPVTRKAQQQEVVPDKEQELDVADVAATAPRRSKRHKASAHDDAPAEMDVDSPDAGADKQGSAKRKQNVVEGKKSTYSSRSPSTTHSSEAMSLPAAASRERANTSELPAAAPKKVKPAAAERTTRSGRSAKKMDRENGPESSDDSLEIIDAVSELQGEGEEQSTGSADGDENEESGTDDEADGTPEASSVESEYEEKNENFGETDDESGSDKGDNEVGEDDGEAAADLDADEGDAVPKKGKRGASKAKGKRITSKSKAVGSKAKPARRAPRKKSSPGEQMALAVPSLVESDAGEDEGEGEVPQVTRPAPSHPRVRAATVVSDTDSGDEREDLQKTLPRRIQPAPANVDGSKTPALTQKKDLDVVHWQLDKDSEGKVKKGKGKEKGKGKAQATTQLREDTRAGAAATRQPDIIASSPNQVRADAATPSLIPAAAATPYVVYADTQPSPSAQKAPATSAARGSAQATVSKAKVTRFAVAKQAAAADVNEASVPGVGNQTEPNAAPLEAMEDDQDVKPNIGAVASVTYESWPVETDPVPNDGGPLGNLGDQKAAVRPVLTQANTRELFLVMAFNHFIPADNNYRDELIRQALINAADALGEEVIAARLRRSKPYATKLGAIPIPRMSIMRGEIKKKAAQLVAAEYNFAAFGGPDKLALGISEIIAHPTYTHIFPGDHSIRSYDKALPFCHSAIIASIRASHFVKRPYARLPKDKLTSSITDGPEAEELELPAPLIAFHAVATFASLKDWQDGVQNILDFDTNAKGVGSILLAYEKHMTTLRNMRKTNPQGYHLITHYLYMKAAGLIPDDETQDPVGGGDNEVNPEVDMANIGASLKIRRRN